MKRAVPNLKKRLISRPVSAGFSLLAVTLLMLSCAVSDPLPNDYYSGTDKIAGGNPPSVPVVTYTAASRRFDFTASIDPDTSAEVANYIVYFYTGVPAKYYESRFIEAIIPASSTHQFYISGSLSGTFTVIVTGYDGYRESAVTDQNKITFSIP